MKGHVQLLSSRVSVPLGLHNLSITFEQHLCNHATHMSVCVALISEGYSANRHDALICFTAQGSRKQKSH